MAAAGAAARKAVEAVAAEAAAVSSEAHQSLGHHGHTGTPVCSVGRQYTQPQLEAYERLAAWKDTLPMPAAPAPTVPLADFSTADAADSPSYMAHNSPANLPRLRLGGSRAQGSNNV